MLFWGFGRDQGNLSYMGWMLLRGKFPYLATWDSNLPLIVFIHSLAIALLGNSIPAFRIFDIIVQLLIISLIYHLARFLVNKLAGIIASVSYTLLYLKLGYWHTAQRDGFLTLFLLLAAHAFLNYRKSLSNKWLVLTGLIGGLSLLMRPQYLLCLPLFAFWLIWETKKDRIKRLIYLTTFYFLPLFLLLILYWRLGGLKDLYEAVVYYNLKVHSGIRDSLFNVVRGFLAPVPLFLWMGVIWAIVTLKGDELKSQQIILIFGILIVSLLSRIIEGKIWDYHLIPIFAFTSLLGGVGLSKAIYPLSTQISPRGRRALKIIVLLSLIYWIRNVFPWETISDVIKTRSIEGHYPKEIFWRRYVVDKDLEVAQYLKEKTNPNDRIQVWGGAAIIYYRAEREAASRFQASACLVAHKKGRPLLPLQERWRKEFLRDLQATPPKYFIIEDDDFPTYMGLAEDKTSLEIFEEFLELSRWVKRNYYLEGRIENFWLFRHIPK